MPETLSWCPEDAFDLRKNPAPRIALISFFLHLRLLNSMVVKIGSGCPHFSVIRCHFEKLSDEILI